MSLLKLKSSNKVINTIYNFKENFKTENINDLLLIELDDLETFFDKRDDKIKAKIIELRNNKASKKEVLEKLAEMLNITNFEITDTTVEVNFENDIKSSLENDKHEIYFSSNDFKCNEKIVISKSKLVIGKGNDKTSFILSDLEINTSPAELIIFQDCNLEGVKINCFNVLNGLVKFINVNFNNLIICSKGNSKLEFENCKFFNLKESIRLEDNSSINFNNLIFEKQEQSQIILRNNAQIDNDLRIKFKDLILDQTTKNTNKFLTPYTVKKETCETIRNVDITISDIITVEGTLVFDSCSIKFNGNNNLNHLIELLPGSELKIINKCEISVISEFDKAIIIVNQSKLEISSSNIINVNKLINFIDSKDKENTSDVKFIDSKFQNISNGFCFSKNHVPTNFEIKNCTFNSNIDQAKKYSSLSLTERAEKRKSVPSSCFKLSLSAIEVSNSIFFECNKLDLFDVGFTKLSIDKCKFSDSAVGIFTGHSNSNCSIEDCEFEKSDFHRSYFLSFYNITQLNANKIRFNSIGSQFNPIKLDRIINCTFTECKFNKCESSSSPVSIRIYNNNQKINFNNCIFDSCHSHRMNGNAINIFQEMKVNSPCIEILNCKFINCKNNHNGAISHSWENDDDLAGKESYAATLIKECKFENCVERV